MLLGVLCARMTGYRSVVAATAPAALVLLVPDSWVFVLGWLPVHISAMSEPLFTALTAAALLATSTAVRDRSPGARRALAMAIVLAAAATLTRYVGVAVVLTVVLAIILLRTWECIGRRIALAITWGLIALVPTLAFVIWSTALGGSSRGNFGYHALLDYGKLIVGFGHSFVPSSWPSFARWLAVVTALGAVIAVALGFPRRAREFWRDDQEGMPQYRIALLFIVSYLVVVFLGRTFYDVSTTIDARLLAPARGVAYALVVAAVYRALAQYVRTVVVSGGLALLSVALIGAGWSTQYSGLSGGAGTRSPTTPTERALAALPRDQLVVTNLPDRLYLRLKRRSLLLPARRLFTTGHTNADFDKQLAEWGAILSQRGGYAFFGAQFVPIAGPDDLQRVVPLKLISRSGDESLYKVVQP
jgi:hypothetical protein